MASITEDIYFYGHKQGKYACMSNFYPCNFTDENGLQFNCSEQYFMYQKCLMFDPDNSDLLTEILRSKSPTKIKQFGRQVNYYDDNVWAENRYKIMIQALLLKFSQNDDLCEILISTGNQMLYEAAKNDRIWGIGYYANDIANISTHKYGQNLLGKALMEVREQLVLTKDD